MCKRVSCKRLLAVIMLLITFLSVLMLTACANGKKIWFKSLEMYGYEQAYVHEIPDPYYNPVGEGDLTGGSIARTADEFLQLCAENMLTIDTAKYNEKLFESSAVVFCVYHDSFYYRKVTAVRLFDDVLEVNLQRHGSTGSYGVFIHLIRVSKKTVAGINIVESKLVYKHNIFSKTVDYKQIAIIASNIA